MCVTNDDTKYNWDATNSWSGYTYQGNVALYLAIKTINDLIVGHREDEIADYYLELEWVEDFSIVNSKSGYRLYESIHQVKARADDKIKDYEDAIVKLYEKVNQKSEIKSAYLHVIKELNLGQKDWKTNVVELIKEGRQIKKRLGEIKAYRASDLDSKKNSINKIYSSGRNSQANLLVMNCNKRIFHYDKISVENIDTILDKVLEELQGELSVCSTNILPQLTDKIELYKYPDEQYFCSLNDISEKIKGEILRYWQVSNAHVWKLSDPNLKDAIFLCLQGAVDQHVTNRHEKYNEVIEREIPFNKFIEILINDAPIERCKEYYLYLIKRKLLELCEEYHEECKEDLKSEEKCSTCELCRLREQLQGMSEKDVQELVQIINPEVNQEFDELNWPKYCQDLRIKIPFLKGVRDIEQSYESANKFVSYIDKEKKLNLLTAVRDDESDGALMRACRKIVTNPNLYKILMDYEFIISKGLETDSVYKDAGDIMSEYKIEEDHIYHCKNLKIVSLENKIKEFRGSD